MAVEVDDECAVFVPETKVRQYIIGVMMSIQLVVLIISARANYRRNREKGKCSGLLRQHYFHGLIVGMAFYFTYVRMVIILLYYMILFANMS